MDIQIEENLYLGNCDERNLAIYKMIDRVDKETGETKQTKDFQTYFPSLDYAFRYILRKKLMYPHLTEGMEKVLEAIADYDRLVRKLALQVKKNEHE